MPTPQSILLDRALAIIRDSALNPGHIDERYRTIVATVSLVTVIVALIAPSLAAPFRRPNGWAVDLGRRRP